MKKIKILPHQNKLGAEIRPLYFYKAFGKEIKDARIISFGACNFSCPYCKRDGAFRNKDGSICSSKKYELKDLLKVAKDAVKKGQVLRLSGGDPIMYQEESLAIAKKIKDWGGKFSIAHNGSSPEFIRKLIPFLESAAIDLKATKNKLGKIAGLNKKIGRKMYKNSLKTQRILSNAGVLVDVRTPIFANTSIFELIRLAFDICKYNKMANTFWTWRIYKPVKGCNWAAPKVKNVLNKIKIIKFLFPNLNIGLRAKWEPAGFLYFLAKHKKEVKKRSFKFAKPVYTN